MKRYMRLYEDDLRNLVMEHYDVRPSQVTTCYTEEIKGYGIAESTVPVFYIEIEEENENERN